MVGTTPGYDVFTTLPRVSVAEPPPPPSGGAAPEVNPNLAVSTWGQVIPLSMGRRRMPGNVIAGTLQVVSGIAYFTGMVAWGGNIDLDTSLTEPTAVYANGAKIWSSTEGYLLPGGWVFEFNKGTETQLPFAGYIALVGAANATANRGLMTGWFANLPLAAFGNVMPGLSAEITGVNSVASEVQFTGSNTDYAVGTDWATRLYGGAVHAAEYDWLTRAELDLTASDFYISNAAVEYLSWIDRIVGAKNTAPRLWQHATAASGVVLSQTGAVTAFDAIGGSEEGFARVCSVPMLRSSDGQTETHHLSLTVGPFGATDLGWRLRAAKYDPALGTLVESYVSGVRLGGLLARVNNTGDDRISVAGFGNRGFVFGLQASDLTEVYFMGVTACTVSSGTYELFRLSIAPGNSYTITSVASITDSGFVGYADALKIARLVYVAADDTIVLVYATKADHTIPVVSEQPTSCRFIKWSRAGATLATATGLPNMYGTTTQRVLIQHSGYSNPSDVIGSTFLTMVGRNPTFLSGINQTNIYAVDVNTGAVTTYPLPASFASKYALGPYLYNASTNEVVIGAYDADLVPEIWRVRLGGGSASSDFPLVTYMEQVGNLAGLLDAELTYTDIDDAIGGGLIAGPTTYGEFALNLGRGFDFDFFESATLKHIRRVVAGAFTVDHVIPTKDLVPTDGQAVVTRRPNPDGIPDIVRCEYIDETQQFRWSTQPARIERLPTDPPRASVTAMFAVPVIITADQGLNCAARALWREQAEKVVHVFTLTRHWLKIEPGDVIQFTANSRTYTTKARRVEIRDDWAVVIEATDLWTSPALALTAEAGAPLAPYDGTAFTGFVMSAEHASIVLSGQDATLTLDTAGFELLADAGMFTLTGQDAELSFGTSPGSTRVTTGADRRVTTGGDVRVTA